MQYKYSSLLALVSAVTLLLEGMGKSVQTRQKVDDGLDIDDIFEDLAGVNDGDADDGIVKGALEELDVGKRDHTSFNAALNYASGALKSGPKVQLGTGEGGSGVGIIQKARGVKSGGAATNGTAKVRRGGRGLCLRSEGGEDGVFDRKDNRSEYPNWQVGAGVGTFDSESSVERALLM